MTQQRRDNYEYTKEQSRSRFLEYDQEHMIRRFSLRADENHLYVPFAGGKYRIDRPRELFHRAGGPVNAVFSPCKGHIEMGFIRPQGKSPDHLLLVIFQKP